MPTWKRKLARLITEYRDIHFFWSNIYELRAKRSQLFSTTYREIAGRNNAFGHRPALLQRFAPCWQLKIEQVRMP